jgi:hypothetical protein
MISSSIQQEKFEDRNRWGRGDGDGINWKKKTLF